jgi:hypothetical protein
VVGGGTIGGFLNELMIEVICVVSVIGVRLLSNRFQLVGSWRWCRRRERGEGWGCGGVLWGWRVELSLCGWVVGRC